jgi:hypothetical protein
MTNKLVAFFLLAGGCLRRPSFYWHIIPIPSPTKRKWP